MKNAFLSNPFQKFLLSLVIVLSCLLVFSILAMILFPVIFPQIKNDITLLANDLTNPENIAALKFIQLIQGLAVFIAAPLLTAYFIGSKHILGFLKLKNIPSYQPFLISIAIILVSVPLVNAMGEINSWLHLPDGLQHIENWMKQTEKAATDLTIAFLQPGSFLMVLYNFLIIAIIPALGEEMLFRGIFQQLFIRLVRNSFWGITLTSFIFAALHLQFFSFLPRFALGLLLGYLFLITGSLWVPILVHFVNNGMAILIAMFSGNQLNESYYDKVGTTSETWMLCIVSAMGLSVLIYLLVQVSSKQQKVNGIPDNLYF